MKHCKKKKVFANIIKQVLKLGVDYIYFTCQNLLEKLPRSERVQAGIEAGIPNAEGISHMSLIRQLTYQIIKKINTISPKTQTTQA